MNIKEIIEILQIIKDYEDFCASSAFGGKSKNEIYLGVCRAIKILKKSEKENKNGNNKV